MAKRGGFTIDDAFEESEEDKIRLYNSESSPLQLVFSEEDEKNLERDEEDDDVAEGFQEFQSRSTNPISKPVKSIMKNSILLNPSLRGLKSRDDNASIDSNSLIQGQTTGYCSSSQDSYWWHHPKVRQNLKVVVAALILVILGACLLLTGVIIYCFPSLKGIQGFIFLIAGFICFLPGGYHLIYVYLAVKGKRGFDFNHLPLFT
jgi:hypothetical protein